MHHHNHRHSTSNHSNPQHHQPNNNIPKGPSPGGASTPRKSNFLNKVREKFREPDTTKEEVEQLGLRAKKETYKTQIYKAKHQRPSKMGSILFGSPQPQPSRQRYSRQPRYEESNSFLFNNNSNGWSESNNSFGNGLNDMLGVSGGSERRSSRKKQSKSGFDQMFGLG